MSSTKSNGLLTAAVLLALGANTNSFAQQFTATEGIARITDGKSKLTAGRAGSPRIQQTSARQLTGNDQPIAPETSAPVNSPIPSGNCENGNCQFGGNYDQGGCPNGRGLGGKFAEHTCRHSPDYGYSPPAKYPLQRRGVEYTNYYPAKWYGAGGDYIPSQAPMVYQPTDTTQLGFYYQHVPYWQPQPNNLPPRPIPAQWHITAPAVEASGFCRGGSNCRAGGNANCWGNGLDPSGRPRRTVFGYLRGDGYGQDYYESGWYPANSSTNSPGAQPSAAPNGSNPGEVVRPYGTPPTPVNPAPRPIETNPSAMLPPSPGPTTLKSEPYPYLPPLPSKSDPATLTSANQQPPVVSNTSAISQTNHEPR